jgi:hypothetical protein
VLGSRSRLPFRRPRWQATIRHLAIVTCFGLLTASYHAPRTQPRADSAPAAGATTAQPDQPRAPPGSAAVQPSSSHCLLLTRSPQRTTPLTRDSQPPRSLCPLGVNARPRPAAPRSRASTALLAPAQPAQPPASSGTATKKRASLCPPAPPPPWSPRWYEWLWCPQHSWSECSRTP